MSSSDYPAPEAGFVLTHFIVSADVSRSRDFYVNVLGGEDVMSGEPTIVKLANGWVIINVGGGPTEDKPDVVLEPPTDPQRVSAFLNIRVADINATYEEWRARGATFLTPPMTLVAAPNCAIDELNAAIKDVGTTPSGAVAEDQWPAIQATVVPALGKVEATGRDWAAALLRAEWPPPVASDVEKLALAATETASRYGEIATAKDFDAFFELYNSADTSAVFAASAAAAKTVREDLGLDSVTTNPPDWCAVS